MVKAKKKSEESNKKIVMMVMAVLLIIFLVLYFLKWQQVKKEEKYLNSYLVSTNTISLEITSLNEIKDVLSETPNEYFVYISYTKDEFIYNLETKLQPIINKYNLEDCFYFLNVTEIKKTNNYKEIIANDLNISENDLDTLPVILHFKNSSLNTIIHNDKEFSELVKNTDY